MALSFGDPEPPEPTLCDEMAGRCEECPERDSCEMTGKAAESMAEEEVAMEEERLIEGARLLAERRAHLALLKSELSARQAEFEAANRDLVEAVRWWSDEVSAQEAMIRDSWAERLRTDPVPGFTVYAETMVEYDPDRAVQWCISHDFLGLLRLESKGFERVAVQLRPEFVAVRERQRVRIARDLSRLLEVSDGSEGGPDAVRGPDGERDLRPVPPTADRPEEHQAGSGAGVRREAGAEGGGGRDSAKRDQ